MKKYVVLLFLLAVITISAQEKPIKTFEFGALGGINFDNIERIGGSAFIEGRYAILPNLKIKLSLGYNNLVEGKNQAVKTYSKTATGSGDKYQTLSYTIEKYSYETIPISFGVEYSLGTGSIIPYLTAEGGYNSFSVNVVTGLKYYGAGGTFNSHGELPAEYRSQPPGFFTGDSYRIAPGAGVRFAVNSILTADLRYSYQVNTSLINTHLFLFGVAF